MTKNTNKIKQNKIKQRADPKRDPRPDLAGQTGNQLPLTIGRKNNPRHLLNGHLFEFLKKNIRLSGKMSYVTIGTIDFMNHMARTDALLESIIPISGHSRRHYGKKDKRRSSMAPSHNNLHQLLPTLARNTKYQYFYDKHMMEEDDSYDEKTDSVVLFIILFSRIFFFCTIFNLLQLISIFSNFLFFCVVGLFVQLLFAFFLIWFVILVYA